MPTYRRRKQPMRREDVPEILVKLIGYGPSIHLPHFWQLPSPGVDDLIATLPEMFDAAVARLVADGQDVHGLVLHHVTAFYADRAQERYTARVADASGREIWSGIIWSQVGSAEFHARQRAVQNAGVDAAAGLRPLVEALKTTRIVELRCLPQVADVELRGLLEKLAGAGVLPEDLQQETAALLERFYIEPPKPSPPRVESQDPDDQPAPGHRP